jgi:hypothetical protein
MGTASSSSTRTPAPFKYIEPVTKINGVGAGQVATIEYPPQNRIHVMGIQATVTVAAAGAGNFSIPVVANVIGLLQVKVGGKPQRTRQASEIWGIFGLNSLCYNRGAGTVVYTQAANANLSVIASLIGSAQDLAQQALLVANTATTATFFLPILWAEPYRKGYAQTEVMALVQGFADGTNIGLVTVELSIPAAGNLSNQAIAAWYEYDQVLAAVGGTVLLSKEYRFTIQYQAAGNIECATQLYERDALQRIRLLTTTDQIGQVVVKQGARILRNFTLANISRNALVTRDYYELAMPTNAFDLEFDLNDNPMSAPLLNPNQPLSIVATLLTANDATKNIVVLCSYYGGVD